MKHRYGWLIAGISVGMVLTIALNGTIAWAVLNPRREADQVRVWKFQPNAASSEQMKRDAMTAEGRFLFMASFPRVEDRDAFDASCEKVTGDTSILGCYDEHTKVIRLFHETDSRLDGTEEVMAAHEMLRAAWDRMSTAQHRALVPALNAVVAANPIPDLDLPDRVESVLSHDPKDSDAETYAIVGTEVPTVSRTLAKSYAVFLRDRSVVTKLNAHATAYLIALKKKVDALSATMDALNTTLDKEVPAFNSAVAALNRDIDSFNRRAETLGGFYSQQQFTVARAALINRQDSLKRRDKAINAQVDTYNADLTTLKGLSATAASLQPGLNVTLSPVPDLQTA